MKTRKRIFVAVNLPDKIKEKLIGYQSQWNEIPANWTKKENLHITLSFLGYLADEDLPDVLVATEKVAAKAESFSVVLDKICYGPKGKNPPRMIWATGESEELSNLQRELEKSLIFSIEGDETKINQSKKNTIHVTLARIRQWDFRRIDPEESPIIDNDIAISFPVNSVDIMESVLKKGGPKYIVLESYSLEH
ncbi:MAG: 2'-5' RNA ligase, 2'-5' RNA ligase [Parcubacteria group bacterium GW2011_GWC1_38_6]|nr:MAG: 2'-5' RNA ligase, 2'-5' RNA ligase [Parcubacteria group bacterium GW2011_GWC1_38_6]